MTANNDISSNTNANSEFLHKILDAYADLIDQRKEETDFSKVMLDRGAKTELTSTLENLLQNPLGEILNLSNKLDQTGKTIIDKIVQSFLQSQNDIIESAFRTQTNGNDLHYCIVLKEDSNENRKKLYSFLGVYEANDYSKKFPIYFQFVPLELKDAIPKQESILGYAGAH